MALPPRAPGARPMLLCALALGAAVADAELKRTTVLVMRHCVRSTEDEGIFAVPNHTFYDNYSSQPWASFGNEPMACLDRGLEIIRAQGKWLAQGGNLPQPVRVFADTVSRDEETGKALLDGLGLPANRGSLMVDDSIFYVKGGCNMTYEERALALDGCVAAQPRGIEFAAMEQKLVDILGVGDAGNWRLREPCGMMSTDTGAPAGACQAASSFAERLFMEWGGGMKVGWGKIDADKLPEIMKLHTWYRTVKGACKAVVAKEQASIVSAVMKTLADGRGTMVYAGHDTQMNALQGLLGLTWRPSPWPDNPTMPGSALRFDREGDTVSVSYVYVKNYSETTGAMETVNVEVAGSDRALPHMISMAALKTLVENGADAGCVTPLPKWPKYPSLEVQQFSNFTRFFKEVTALLIIGICCLCCWCLHCADTKSEKQRTTRGLRIAAQDEEEESQAVPMMTAVQATPCPSEAPSQRSGPPAVDGRTFSRPATAPFEHGPGFATPGPPPVWNHSAEPSGPPPGSFVYPQETYNGAHTTREMLAARDREMEQWAPGAGTYANMAMESTGQVARGRQGSASGSAVSGRSSPHASSGIYTPAPAGVYTPGSGVYTPAPAGQYPPPEGPMVYARGSGPYPPPGTVQPLDPSRIRQSA